VIDGEREYGYGLMSKVMSMWNIVFKLGAVIMYLMSWVFLFRRYLSRKKSSNFIRDGCVCEGNVDSKVWFGAFVICIGGFW
jgi:hypothetical protein